MAFHSVVMLLHYGCGTQNDEDARFSELHSSNLHVRAKFEVRTAVSSRVQIFSDVTPCHCVNGSRRFERTWCFYH
jgi:hypothetical protein